MICGCLEVKRDFGTWMNGHFVLVLVCYDVALSCTDYVCVIASLFAIFFVMSKM